MSTPPTTKVILHERNNFLYGDPTRRTPKVLSDSIALDPLQAAHVPSTPIMKDAAHKKAAQKTAPQKY